MLPVCLRAKRLVTNSSPAERKRSRGGNGAWLVCFLEQTSLYFRYDQSPAKKLGATPYTELFGGHIELSYAHVVPGEYSELYAVISNIPPLQKLRAVSLLNRAFRR